MLVGIFAGAITASAITVLLRMLVFKRTRMRLLSEGVEVNGQVRNSLQTYNHQVRYRYYFVVEFQPDAAEEPHTWVSVRVRVSEEEYAAYTAGEPKTIEMVHLEENPEVCDSLDSAYLKEPTEWYLIVAVSLCVLPICIGGSVALVYFCTLRNTLAWALYGGLGGAFFLCCAGGTLLYGVGPDAETFDTQEEDSVRPPPRGKLTRAFSSSKRVAPDGVGTAKAGGKPTAEADAAMSSSTTMVADGVMVVDEQAPT